MFDRITKDTSVALFYLFVVLLLAWTTTQTYAAAQMAMPDDAYAPYIAVGLFDVGAAAWLLAFLKHAKGTQRTIAFWLTFADFAGIVLMVGGALGVLSINAIRLTLLGATIGNVLAVYVYHLSSPANREAIQAQGIEDMLVDEALQQARYTAEREARSLGSILARRATARIKYRLALPMTEDERAEWNGETVDAKAEDVPSLPSPAEEVPAWARRIFRFFGKGRTGPQPEPITTSPTTGSNSDEAEPGSEAASQ